ncbi:hypothetical protein [Bacillus wiedmannii]|uniref:hypothetical protein n=1 Tax=Bacillus wiedmannii TaxID=1890302 RepID=UPI000BF0D16D|nr:hypothetical protein [Bacillus wiedmannii]PEK57838.1 hypothetical protein CN595_25065 [Bacillus wiedmannii]PEL55801.1 hypothetical protein CN622_26120 [Bacillus wiedmannii]PEP05324.1 hypothetical protein CN552_28665 [Bacillus wiedmannii]PEQ03277.1 hypothetical protein CN587_18290 [Bacillus wiedmannii]PEU26478.1 hypothetical protein CN526_16340 [Bacillus wiedmannii]
MFKNVTVTLDGIYCDSALGDPGNDLEIYGSLDARVGFYLNTPLPWRIPLDRQALNLFQKDPDDYVSISENSLYILGNSFSFVMSDGDYCRFGGILADEDSWPNANDELGKTYQYVDFNSLPDVNQSKPYPVYYYDENNEQRAYA